MAQSIEQFSYELTSHALADQERAATALRTRGLASSVWVLLPHQFVFAARGQALLAQTDHLGVLVSMATTPPKTPSTAKPPAQLPAEAPPGFALPEKRPSLFGSSK
jgi:hypothetical protein